MKIFALLMMIVMFDGTLSSCQSSSSNQTTNVNTNNGNVSVNTNTPSNTKEMTNDKIRLETTITRVNDKQLKVRYKATNTGNIDAFIFNRLPNRGADVSSVGAGKYYLVPTSDGAVEISKRAFFISESGTASSGTQVLPAAMRLSPGKSFEEEFNVTLPLKISHPYKDVAKLPAMPNPANKVKFCLGVVQDDIMNARERVINGESLLFLTAEDTKKQQLVCGDVQSLE